MSKMMNVLMGLAFIALGVLGITGLIPMFTINQIYVSIGEILFGTLGLLVGIYAKQNPGTNQQSRDNARQKKDIAVQRKEIAEQRKDSYDQKKKENDQLKKDNVEQLKEKNKQQRKANKAL